MKSVLMSIRPKWCNLIASGKKTIEVRKTKPNIETPFKCYIYCTSVKSLTLGEYVEVHRKTCGKIDDWNEKVIAEFVCDGIDTYDDDTIHSFSNEDYCRWNDFENYANDKWLYGWHISDLKIYDKPKELNEFGSLVKTIDWERGTVNLFKENKFYKPMKRPPVSWCYVEEI